MKTATIDIQFTIDFDPAQEPELRKKLDDALNAFESYGFRLKDLSSTPVKLSAVESANVDPRTGRMTEARRRELGLPEAI